MGAIKKLECPHYDMNDMSVEGSGYIARKCFECGLIQYWKIYGSMGEGKIVSAPIHPSLVPEYARIS